MPVSVELSTDRYPVDPRLRRLAHRVLAHVAVSQGPFIKTPEDLVNRMTPWWARPPGEDVFGRISSTRKVGAHTLRMVADLPPLVDALVQAGHFSFVGEHLVAHPDPAYATVPLPRDRMLGAFADRMAARRVGDPGQRKTLADMFLKLRALHWVHDTRDGGLVGRKSRAILIPGGYRIDPVRGPVIQGGYLVEVGPHGTLVGRWAPPSAITVAFPTPERAVVTLDPRRIRKWPKKGFTVGNLTVSPVRNRRVVGIDNVSLEPDWRWIGIARADAAAYLGFDMGGRQWKSFSASVRRANRIEPHIGRIVFDMIDPEIRRACLRTPRAVVGLANWFVEAGPEARVRRLQASAAYPHLTPYLFHVEHEIDGGLPLAPALSASLGLPLSFVRHLSGLHWQALGKAHSHLLATREKAANISYMASVIPPERLPRTKVEWEGFARMAPKFVTLLGAPETSRLTKDASLDWARTALVCGRGLDDVYHVLAGVIRDACCHAFSRGGHNEWDRGDRRIGLRRLVTRAVVGRDGGLGRLARLDLEFHRNVNAYRQANDAIKLQSRERAACERGSAFQPRETWLPLTDEPYLAEGGSITWVTDVPGLVEEGEAMNHCVAYRDHACLSGVSHIGRVAGADGGRSTVDFTIYSRGIVNGVAPVPSWTISIVEHKGRSNRSPSPDCERLVASFVRNAPNRVSPNEILAAGAAYAEWRRRTLDHVLLPEEALDVLRVYEGLIDPAYRGLSTEEWVALLNASLAMPIPSVGEGCVLDDQTARTRRPYARPMVTQYQSDDAQRDF